MQLEHISLGVGSINELNSSQKNMGKNSVSFPALAHRNLPHATFPFYFHPSGCSHPQAYSENHMKLVGPSTEVQPETSALNCYTMRNKP